MSRTTTGFTHGHFYTVYEEDIKPLAKKLGISVGSYVRINDELLALFSMGCDGKGADKFDLDEYVAKLIRLVLESKGDKP